MKQKKIKTLSTLESVTTELDVKNLTPRQKKMARIALRIQKKKERKARKEARILAKKEKAKTREQKSEKRITLKAEKVAKRLALKDEKLGEKLAKKQANKERRHLKALEKKEKRAEAKKNAPVYTYKDVQVGDTFRSAIDVFTTGSKTPIWAKTQILEVTHIKKDSLVLRDKYVHNSREVKFANIEKELTEV